MKVELETGDVVYLTSDLLFQNPFTVESINEDNTVNIVWIDFGSIQRDVIASDCLVIDLDLD